MIIHICKISDTTISFEKPVYGIEEYDGAIHPVLILSNPVSKDVTVNIISTDGSADGNYPYAIVCYYSYIAKTFEQLH